MFKKNYKSEIKVAQLSGAVSELSNYHHGEMSLQNCIINLAQDYTGSNNWNLLKPNGQYGSRLQLGRDHASPRYIFTELSEYTKKLFNNTDFEIVDYIEEEGVTSEPEYYVPVLSDEDFFNDVFNLIADKLVGVPNSHHVTFFESSRNDLLNLNYIWKNNPGDINHLNNEGNMLVAEIVNQMLKR